MPKTTTPFSDTRGQAPLPEPLLELVAARFRALSDPVRLRMLHYLRNTEATVQELADVVGTSQGNASRHIQLLAQAGLVTRTRDAQRTMCSLAGPHVAALCDAVCTDVLAHETALGNRLRGAQ